MLVVSGTLTIDPAHHDQLLDEHVATQHFADFGGALEGLGLVEMTFQRYLDPEVKDLFGCRVRAG